MTIPYYMRPINYFFLCGLILCLSTHGFGDTWCDIEKEYSQFEYTPAAPYIKLNPFGNAPLTALLKFSLPEKASVSLELKGKDGAPDLTRSFQTPQTEWEIPVYGLYPQTDNQLNLTVHFPNFTQTYPITIKTNAIGFNQIWSIPIKNQKDQNHFYWASGGKNGGSAFVFDEHGHIRYVFNEAQDSTGKQTRLLHGYLVTDSGDGKIVIRSLLGEQLYEWNMPNGFQSYNHGIYEGPDQTILVIGSLPNTRALISGVQMKTAYDHIMAFDLQGKLVKKWNLASVLNPDRSLYFELSPKISPADWAHLNSVQYIPEDQALLISAKHIGFFKIDYDSGKLKWLATPHMLLHKSGADGKGPSLLEHTLVAVDENQRPYSEDIQQGKKNLDTFHWPMMNHDVKQIAPGLISVFSNNGPLYRKDLASIPTSDALLFSVDEEKKTISLKKKIELSEYADLASGVTYMPDNHELMIFSANLHNPNTRDVFNKLYRYDLNTDTYLFEDILIYRSYFYKIEPISFEHLKELPQHTSCSS